MDLLRSTPPRDGRKNARRPLPTRSPLVRGAAAADAPLDDDRRRDADAQDDDGGLDKYDISTIPCTD